MGLPERKQWLDDARRDPPELGWDDYEARWPNIADEIRDEFLRSNELAEAVQDHLGGDPAKLGAAVNAAWEKWRDAEMDRRQSVVDAFVAGLREQPERWDGLA